MSSIPVNNESADARAETTEAALASARSYSEILKSSALIGGSSLVNIGIGIVRTKAMALMLGPSGMGLMGLYGSVADLTVSVAGMGVNSSGVRQIAEAVGTGDTDRIARTAAVLRRTSLLLGIAGGLLLVVFSRQASTLTFGTSGYAGAVALLSIAVFFRLVSGGQGALIQGTRRISDLARINVAGALAGTVIAIPVVYFFREQGVVPTLVAVAATSLAPSWWYSRKIQLSSPPMNAAQTGEEAAALLKLGIAFMASALLTMGSAYAVRIIVFRKVGFDATGLYQAAWTLGGLYVGMILQAMGADFYPRLTACAGNNSDCNRLVNEQTRVGLLVSGPGIIATLAVAPVVIALFYSSKFGPAVPILRWICLGVALRVITWPMGYIIIAKGEQRLLIWSELAWAAVNIGLTWVFVRSFGVNGAGIAFFGSYVFHGCLIYPIVSRLSGFHWSGENQKAGLLFISSVTIVFSALSILPFTLATAFGIVVAALSTVYSVRTLFALVPPDQMPEPIRHSVARFRS